MRRFIQWTFVPVAVVALAACGKRDTHTSTAMNADLQRDLKLASATQTLQINPDEIAPNPRSSQELAGSAKEAPQGPRVVRSAHPTVAMSAKMANVAQIKAEVPQIEVAAASPAPSETPTVDVTPDATPGAPPLARPSPVPPQTYPTTERIPENRPGGSVVGGIIGAVIRGGVIGDDDHCDPRGPHRGGGIPIGGDIGGGIFGGGIGGIVGARRGRPQ
ncbi:MAG TPA: hypothetical protein VGM67_03255 [Gemmatimonadaceae bacterium]